MLCSNLKGYMIILPTISWESTGTWNQQHCELTAIVTIMFFSVQNTLYGQKHFLIYYNTTAKVSL